MKKTVVFNGVAAGILLGAMFVIPISIQESPASSGLTFTLANILLIAALSLVFFAIRNVRDRQQGGFISFNQAFKAGMTVILIGTSIYTSTKVVYALTINKTYIEASLDKTMEEESKRIIADKDIKDSDKQKMIQSFKENMDDLKSPWAFALSSTLDVFPMGLVITLLCSALMKREYKSINPAS
jgi:uncharacterized membrane protein (UPF0136 family)